MKKSLMGLRQELEQLERIVLDEYVRLEAEAAAGGEDYIRIPARVAHWFRHHLEGLWEDLFGRGESGLALVSDEHEEVRLRLMVLDRLLDRDIPFAYLERALSRHLDLRLRVVQPAPAKPRVVEVAPPLAVERSTGWWALARAWLSGLLGLLQGNGGASLGPRRQEPKAAPIAPAVSGPGLSEELQRLILLYRLLQEDAEGLVPVEQRLGPLDTSLTLTGEVARFYARDIHEQFWRVRVEPGEALARTPEELRRKLQGRNYRYEERETRSRNAA